MAFPVIITVAVLGGAYVALGKARKDMPTVGAPSTSATGPSPDIAPDAIDQLGPAIAAAQTNGDAMVGPGDAVVGATPGGGEIVNGGMGLSKLPVSTGQDPSTSPSCPTPQDTRTAPPPRQFIVSAPAIAVFGTLQGVSHSQQATALAEFGPAMGEVW